MVVVGVERVSESPTGLDAGRTEPKAYLNRGKSCPNLQVFSNVNTRDNLPGALRMDYYSCL
jgi:hypothetical protein